MGKNDWFELLVLLPGALSLFAAPAGMFGSIWGFNNPNPNLFSKIICSYALICSYILLITILIRKLKEKKKQENPSNIQNPNQSIKEERHDN